MPSAPILVVGSYVRDLVFRCAQFPRPGETVVGGFMTAHGGKGSNQAVAAARAGGRVTFIGAVGDDAFGAEARAFHAAEGIDCQAATKPGHPTGTAGIVVDAAGQNQIIVALNANDALSAADLDARGDLVRGAGLVVVQLEANLGAVARAMQIAREAGVPVLLNPAPMREDFDPELLRLADILVPNETEFATLVGILPSASRGHIVGEGFNEERLSMLSEAQVHELCRMMAVETVIVTLGRRGCFVSRPDGYKLIPAVPGISAVDTTGAGDAFVGAFAAAMTEFGSGEIERAARFANAGAAISVTRAGAAPAMPKREEIEALLQRTSSHAD